MKKTNPTKAKTSSCLYNGKGKTIWDKNTSNSSSGYIFISLLVDVGMDQFVTYNSFIFIVFIYTFYNRLC